MTATTFTGRSQPSSIRGPVDDAASFATEELLDDIFDGLREQEPLKMPNITMMDSQPEIQWSMRPRLLGFLMEAQSSFHLDQSTFSLAVSIMDRYTSKRIIYNRHYQLVGCVSLWIAAKFLGNKHEVPSVTDLAYLCANTFSRTMFREMEMHIMSSLNWNVGAPTSTEFVDLMISRLHLALGVKELADKEMHHAVAVHIAECGLFDRHVLSFPPSIIAASALELSCLVMDAGNGIHREPAPIPGSDKSCIDALADVIATSQPYFAGRQDQYRYNVPALVTQYMELGRRFEKLSSQRSPESMESLPIGPCMTPGASDSEESNYMDQKHPVFNSPIDRNQYNTAQRVSPLPYKGLHGIYMPPTPEELCQPSI